MRMTVVIVFIFVAASGLTGCSSISLPSLPSFSWSKSAPPPDPTAEALFEEGTRYFKEKRYARAIDVWQKIKTDHPFSPVLAETELKIADAYYLNKQYPEAVAAFKEFQSLHPTNENIPFVVYRLGQAHFDQFSATDREQKNTEIARGHFETVITSYPKSPYVPDAREKLAKSLEYLAESDFNVASFYFQQEKYPAARDRFEEIVRKYRDTPTAIKSLFYLGESYRKEKNGVKAALAYEALIQHYPKSKFAAEAKTQLAQLEKEKHDPLAMLLMRDRRAAPADDSETNSATAKSERLKGLELIAKKEVVHEEPGDEKTMFRRVVDKINPFSSSTSAKREEKQPETAEQLMIKKKAAEKTQSGGMFSWLNPFSGKSSKEKPPAGNNGFVNQIDDSLQQKGIDVSAREAALKPPGADLPNVEEAKPPTAETSKLLAGIDSSLNKVGKSSEMPAPPEAAEVFRDTAAAQAIAAKATGKPEPSPSPATSGLLGSIDQKLKSQGLEPAQYVAPPTPPQSTGSIKEKPKTVELEPKLSMEKGPLFLSPAEVSVQEKTGSAPPPQQPEKKPEIADKQTEPAAREIPRSVVRGPAQPQAPATKPTEPRKPEPGQEEEPKGFFEQLREDAERVGRILNPFRW